MISVGTKFIKLFESDAQSFVDRFIQQANDFTDIRGSGTGASLGGFDTSFHVTTKIKHILVRFSNEWRIGKMIANAEERGDMEKVARLKDELKKSEGAVAFLRQKFADYISNMPDRTAHDLKSGNQVDPFSLLKRFFPGGEPGHIEQDIREIGLVVKSTRGSLQDVHNLAELAENEGLEMDPDFREELTKETYGMSREEMERESAEFMREIMNPEFRDQTDLGDGSVLSTPIDPDEPT